jgi:hypothetical protein
VNTNQARAVELAAAVGQSRVRTDALPEHDWDLLLLAAGVRCAAAAPEVVCQRVLADAGAGRGYFAGVRSVSHIHPSTHSSFGHTAAMNALPGAAGTLGANA